MDIQEKKLKEILISQREEYQRYLGVLAENFGSQLKLVIESLKGTQDQLGKNSALQNTQPQATPQLTLPAPEE